jgi:hypothetical protein
MGGSSRSSGYQLPRVYFVMQRMKIVCLLPLYLCTETKELTFKDFHQLIFLFDVVVDSAHF